LKLISDRLIESFITDKTDNSFLDKDIPQLKSLLQDTLNALDERLYFIDEVGDLIPNEDFKNLINAGILTTSTLISSKFKRKVFSGYLTMEGFFELNVDGKKILFSTFRAAAEFAWNKVIPTDGWNIWTATDKNGGNYSLKHYRQILRKYHSS
jgi:hypothetical protein